MLMRKRRLYHHKVWPSRTRLFLAETSLDAPVATARANLRPPCKSATAVQNSASRLTLAAIYDFKVNPNSLDKVFFIFLSLGDTDLGLCEELLGNSLMSSKDYLYVVLFRIGNLLNFVGLTFVELLRLKSREKVLFD